jgi:hypothetical protein
MLWNISILGRNGYADLVAIPDPWAIQASVSSNPSVRSSSVTMNIVLSEVSNYIVISHVWSNGTGVGIKQSGYVNSCLFSYFADVAKSLDCDSLR